MPSTTVMARRRVFVCPEATALKALDTGLRTVLAVETIRGVNGSGKVEIRYFLSSCGDDPKVLIQAIRRHLDYRKWAPLGPRCHVPGGRQPRPGSHGSSQPGHSAQDRHQPHKSGSNSPRQHPSPAQASRLK